MTALAALLGGLLAVAAPTPTTPTPPPPAAAESPEAHAGSPAPPAAEHGQAAPAGEHVAAEGAPAHEKDEEHGVAAILMHHVVNVRYGDLILFEKINLGPTKHLLFFGLTALIVIVVIRIAIWQYRGGVPRGLGALVEALLIFVRDEIAEKNIGHGGRKYAPLLLSFFFFILTAALLGLMPFSSTATGNLSVTLGLAFVSFLAQQWAGISENGFVHHFKGLVPPGMPVFLLPIMIPVEILSMFTKPFALMIRLFANMLAGHMVIITLLLLIPLMAAISTAFGIFMIPVSLSLAIFIMFLELLVAFIQAYIFTLLTAIFMGMYAHPAH